LPEEKGELPLIQHYAFCWECERILRGQKPSHSGNDSPVFKRLMKNFMKNTAYGI
jgi:hypothetical protein